MNSVSKIIIAGQERTISSYRNLAMKESGSISDDISALSPHQYLSCLFNNLGYDKCPKDFLWMDCGIDVELVPKTEILDYPITNLPLMLHENCTLFTFLMCVKAWINGGMERGYIVDPNKSFKYPDPMSIQYALQNRIKITRNATIRPYAESWDKADIMWRRMYNVSPVIDKTYFEYCVPNFEQVTNCIKLSDPKYLFVATLMNPDILMSIIKQAEIEAVSNVFAKHSDIQFPALLDEIEIDEEFAKTLDLKLRLIKVLYQLKGPSAFITNDYQVMNARKGELGEIELMSPINLNDPNTVADTILINEVYKQIANIPIDGDTKAFVLKYVDMKSLQFIENLGFDHPIRLATIRRLYYTLQQLHNCHPEILNPKDRFILVEDMYIDPDRFALYYKSSNKFYVIGLDLILREMDPMETVEYYQTYLGKTVWLNPDVVSVSMTSEPVPYIDLVKIYLNLTTPAYTDPQPQQVQQNFYPQIPANNIELYGFDPRRLVENIF